MRGQKQSTLTYDHLHLNINFYSVYRDCCRYIPVHTAKPIIFSYGVSMLNSKSQGELQGKTCRFTFTYNLWHVWHIHFTNTAFNNPTDHFSWLCSFSDLCSRGSYWCLLYCLKQPTLIRSLIHLLFILYVLFGWISQILSNICLDHISS